MPLYENTEIMRFRSTIDDILYEKITTLLKSLQAIALRRF